VLEQTAEKCSDGIDNDNNGYADCQDFSCLDNDDVSVRRVCQESTADCAFLEADGGCAAANAACSNKDANGEDIDDDGDGFANCADWDCSYNPLVTVCPGPRICD